MVVLGVGPIENDSVSKRTNVEFVEVLALASYGNGRGSAVPARLGLVVREPAALVCVAGVTGNSGRDVLVHLRGGGEAALGCFQ